MRYVSPYSRRELDDEVNSMKEQITTAFYQWIDRILSAYPVNVAAYNFNFYENEVAFAIQLAGAARFDRTDPSWACDEVFTSGEDLFEIPRAIAGADWQSGLAAAKQLIENYVRVGAHSEKLQFAQGIGVGFVDGDLDLILAQGV